MEDGLKSSLRTVCALLRDHDVRYMVVGGMAVALHGYYRHSMGPTGELALKPDVDIWFDTTYENYFKLLRVLEGMDGDVSQFKNEARPEPKRPFFRLDLDEFTLDALPRINAGIHFGDA